MDLEFFDNNTENTTFDPNETYSFHIYYYVEIPTAIVAILSSLANALIIFMSIRFHVLHTRLYFYLANWCICNFVITVSAHATLNVLGFAEIVSVTALCIWLETSFAFMFGNLVFIAALLLDWYILTFTNQGTCSIHCRRYYKLIAANIWVLVLLLLIKSIFYCLDYISMPLLVLIVCLAYFTVTVLILVIFVLRLIKLKLSSFVVEKSNLEFKLALSHFLCWLPNVLFLTVHIIFQLSIILEYLSYIIWYSNACVIFLLLYFNDESFRTCLGSLFHTKFKSSKKDNKDIPLIDV
ncbi:mu-type opioid receptor-like [Anoplophora glabripennis]|uniref:mu-type opioid receptor-like n=1 Tax=Anoplophora glabripennis TaxID=217634 RepID=UPI000875471E|nr:mu-type opioid receptor-like [Anoplophora glabripennis]